MKKKRVKIDINTNDAIVRKVLSGAVQIARFVFEANQSIDKKEQVIKVRGFDTKTHNEIIKILKANNYTKINHKILIDYYERNDKA